ncbi:MAG: M56 family metallopeptidase, partial [Acidobacteriota bacterium]
MSIIGQLLIRSAVLSSLFLLFRLAFRSPSLRSLISRTGLILLLTLPALNLATPRIHVSVPNGWSVPLSLPIPQGSTAAVVETPPHESGADAPRDFPVASIAIAMYSLVAAAMFVRLVISISRLSMLSARATAVCDPRWTSALSTARAKLGFTRAVWIVRSGSLHSPMTWGAFRPVILLDAPTLENAEGAEAILLHELTHIGRGDWLFTILGRFVMAMLWLNPLVILLVRAAHADAELVCDDEVLLKGASPLSYASLLLAFASREAVSTPLPVCAAVRTPEIRNRIQAVLDPNHRRERASLRVVTLLVAAF